MSITTLRFMKPSPYERSMLPPTAWRRLPVTQAVIRRLDKHVGGPRPGRLPVPRVVIACRPGRLHLGQRHPVLDHVLNPVPDDGDHVAVIDDVGVVADAAVGRNHPRSALGVVAWDGKFN